MSLSNQNILFFTRTMKLGGTEGVVLQLCEIFNPLVNNIIVCSCGGVNESKLNEMGIKHFTIPDIEDKNIKNVIYIARELKRIIREEHITIIHTHHRMAAFYVAFLHLYKKCFFINTCHNTFTTRKLLTRFAYKNANIITCGDMVKKNLISYFGMRESQIAVIHNAVKPFDGNLYDDKTIKDLHKAGKFVVGNVGRLSEQKGMEYYLKSVPSVVAIHPEIRFLVIGSGEKEAELRELTASLKVDDYVIFMGYRSDIQNLMSQIDILVLSSLWEGLPLTPIEAFSVGKTIIATAVDGTVEVVKNDQNGILIEPKNPNQISSSIIELYENIAKREKYEYAAFQTFHTSFSISIFAEKYKQYYEEVLQ